MIRYFFSFYEEKEGIAGSGPDFRTQKNARTYVRLLARMGRAGIEPATYGFSVRRSTN